MSLGQAGFVDAIQKIGGPIFSQTGSKLRIRTNVTPEIVIDLSTLAAGAKAITTEHRALLNVIQPQLSVRTLGLQKHIAPFGTPIPNAWIIILFALAASGLVGAKLTWMFCKSR